MKRTDERGIRGGIVVVIVALLALSGCTNTEGELSREEQHANIMEKAEEVSEGIDTPEEAKAAGYEADPFCVPGMGVHWIHKPGEPDSYVDTELNLDQPEVVLFDPGSANLSDTSDDEFLAIEYLVITEGTERNSTETKPDLMGVPFDGPMPGHSPSMPWHVDFHIYLADHVRSGLDFEAEHPDKITCPEGTTPPQGG